MADTKDVLTGVATSILSGLAKKGISEVKDKTVRDFLTQSWGDLETQLPDLAKSLVGAGEVVLSGPYKEKTAEILNKMQGDIFALKKGELTSADFIKVTERRKAAIYALYNASEATGSRPSIQKILNAAGVIATILVKHGLPFILAAL